MSKSRVSAGLLMYRSVGGALQVGPVWVPGYMVVAAVIYAVLTSSAVFPADRPRQRLTPSTLDRPLIVEDMRAGYSG